MLANDHRIRTPYEQHGDFRIVVNGSLVIGGLLITHLPGDHFKHIHIGYTGNISLLLFSIFQDDAVKWLMCTMLTTSTVQLCTGMNWPSTRTMLFVDAL